MRAPPKTPSQDDESPAANDLANALLRTMPAVGVLVARGCIRSGYAVTNDYLVRGIEAARDAMNLPSGDPAWEVVAALRGDAPPAGL